MESFQPGSLRKACSEYVTRALLTSTVVNNIPDVIAENLPPFDYIVCVTKNCPDISPTLVALISPAVTPSHTVIVLVQNGLNIEKPFFATFPSNIILSGVSLIDSHEEGLGHILHEEPDLLQVGAFYNPTLDSKVQKSAAEAFIEIYGKGGKTQCSYCADVPWTRWRKLVFNASFNPICAITGLDDAKVRLVPGLVEGLIRPVMGEIIAAAKALGHDLPTDIDQFMIDLDPMDLYLKPSMQCDHEKVGTVTLPSGQS